jgi:hypothetical protein
MRTSLAALVSLVLLGAAGGCHQQELLVKSPPPPYFGPRSMAVLAPPPAPAHRPAPAPARHVSWNEAEWIPGGAERPWQFIVIHHSATPTGSAADFDRMHRAKGWDELGYHFVIGNGTGSGNGEVEVGSRWTKQKHGAHTKVAAHPEYNDLGIGICLVGNFDVTRPTDAQMESLARLIRCMMRRYAIPRGHIYGHGQLKPTDCPGRNFDYGDLFSRL